MNLTDQVRSCHSERSEESEASEAEILSEAKNDMTDCISSFGPSCLRNCVALLERFLRFRWYNSSRNLASFVQYSREACAAPEAVLNN